MKGREMSNIYILAQADGQQAPSGIEATEVTVQETVTMTAADGNAPATAAPVPRQGYSQHIILFGLMAVLMYFLLFRGPRKKQQQHTQMVQKLQKNDKVRTIGGILGTVVDVKGEEVTLKIDESNNIKIKVISSAIGNNLSQDKIK